MANSLKATFPALSRIVGFTPAALYARQRMFVEAGILESTPGRGPGSGVKATPSTLAEFIIALIAQVTLDENASFAKGIAKAKAVTGKCPLTGTGTFKDAFAAVLLNKKLAARVDQIRIVTNGEFAEIKYGGSLSKFAGKVMDKAGMTIEVAISADTLNKLGDLLADIDQ